MNLDELVGHERIIGELILDRPSPGRHAARQAIAHAQKAQRIRDIDPEMALFRSLTGEEEAARALFHSLQRLGYPGASRLDWHDHKQKAAVVPFLAAMAKLLAQVGFATPEIITPELNGKRSITVRIVVHLPNGQSVTVICDPPLNLQMTIEGREMLLDREISAVASDANFATMEKFVRTLASERNYILYASDQGIPTVGQPIEELLQNRRGNVFSMLALYLLTDSYRQQQPFVTQTLTAFLAMINRLPPEITNVGPA